MSLSCKLPAVVNKHSLTPLSLVAFFHSRDILVKSLIMLITDTSKYAGKHIQMTVKEVQFKQHVPPPITEGFKHIFNNYPVVGWLMFTYKVVSNYFQ
jgi:pectate lyase